MPPRTHLVSRATHIGFIFGHAEKKSVCERVEGRAPVAFPPTPNQSNAFHHLRFLDRFTADLVQLDPAMTVRANTRSRSTIRFKFMAVALTVFR